MCCAIYTLERFLVSEYVFKISRDVEIHECDLAKAYRMHGFPLYCTVKPSVPSRLKFRQLNPREYNTNIMIYVQIQVKI